MTYIYLVKHIDSKCFCCSKGTFYTRRTSRSSWSSGLRLGSLTLARSTRWEYRTTNCLQSTQNQGCLDLASNRQSSCPTGNSFFQHLTVYNNIIKLLLHQIKPLKYDHVILLHLVAAKFGLIHPDINQFGKFFFYKFV